MIPSQMFFWSLYYGFPFPATQSALRLSGPSRRVGVTIFQSHTFVDTAVTATHTHAYISVFCAGVVSLLVHSLARVSFQSKFVFRLQLFCCSPCSSAMGFQLRNPCLNAKPVRPQMRPHVVKDTQIKNGRFVKTSAGSFTPKNSKSTLMTQRRFASSFAARARPSTSTAQARSGRATVRTVCDLLGVTAAPGQIDANAAQDQDGELANATAFATETHKYVEQIKRDIDKGVLDLKCNPWIRPCDPRSAAARLIASRKSATKQTIDSVEVREFVFRPIIFVWAPHLLQP